MWRRVDERVVGKKRSVKRGTKSVIGYSFRDKEKKSRRGEYDNERRLLLERKEVCAEDEDQTYLHHA